MTQSPPVSRAEAETGSERGLAALESLARAARQVALYGLEHPSAARALQDASHNWVAGAGGQTVELRVDGDRLLWNGQPLPLDRGPVSRLWQTMRDRLIAAIGFDPDVDGQELSGLLLLLATDPQKLAASGGAIHAFHAARRSPGVGQVSNLPHDSSEPRATIHLEDMDFTRARRESETSWLETCATAEEVGAEPLTPIVQACLQTARHLRTDLALEPSADGDRRSASAEGAAAPSISRGLRSNRAADVAGTEGGTDAGTGEARARAPSAGAAESASADSRDAALTYVPPSPHEAPAARIAHLIQCAGEAAHAADEGYWQGWRENMIRLIRQLTPEWRARVFRAPCGWRPGRPEVFALIARQMAPSECVSLVLDYPGAIQAEPSRGLELLLSRIMSDPERRDAVERVLHQEAVARGVSEGVYQNVVGTVLDQLKAEPGARFQPVSDDSRTRARQDDSLAWQLAKLLRTTAPEWVRQARLEVLVDLLGADLSPDRYGRALEALVAEAARREEEGDGEGLLTILSALQAAAEEDPAGESDRGGRGAAGTALARCGTSGAVARVVSEVERVSPERRAGPIALLGDLGEKGMAALTALLQRPELAEAEQVVKVILARDSSSLFWMKRVISEASVSSLPRLARILAQTADARVVGQLKVLTDHPDVSVRLELIRAIGEARSPHGGSPPQPTPSAGSGRATSPAAAGVLVRLLSDPVPAVRLAAIKTLGELRAAEAVPALAEMARRQSRFGEGERVRELIVRALGEIGTSAGVAELRRLVLESGLISLLTGSRLRIAAAEALGRIGTPAARAALEAAARSRSRAVQEACRYALTRPPAAAARGGRAYGR